MATECEIKLEVSEREVLMEILKDPMVESIRRSEYRLIEMQTTYYDTPHGELGKRKWMLRQRLEDGVSVITMKTPGSGYVRGEWSVEAESALHAVDRLVCDGAPGDLKQMVQSGLVPICGVQFERITAQMELDGCRFDLCGDCGVFTGGKTPQPFCELELELLQGEASRMILFAGALQERFVLVEQPLSKLVRAMQTIQ